MIDSRTPELESCCRNGGGWTRRTPERRAPYRTNVGARAASAGILLQLFDFGLHGIQLVVSLLFAVFLGLSRQRFTLSQGHFVVAFRLCYDRIACGVGGLFVCLRFCAGNVLVG